MNGLTVGQIAKEAGVNIETIRYYERRGLLPEPPRTNSGYRMFSLETVHDVRFIKRAQELGFTLEEIKRLLSIYRKDDYFPIEEMRQFATEKIGKIEEKIDQLNNFKSILEAVTKRSNSDTTLSKKSCLIMQTLSNGGIHDGKS
ncbi:MerR family transcriptional regulator [Paenibacillus chondroitinus]|uniref:MerR family transcriptional regulator n=1 Tax=Paenibacillus chondroitinus TaxID=59842 RepID=A0ABU6DKV6_9BACL|nr:MULTISPECIES: MerR family transcriptional regulator [Paenibacillus]MCY9657126.1 MerR family transcriptional regulator [Paenibacillus anseongense]MEB4798409.1 MerR family transcriptional regulator [Paenibacillus chondroitinus]